MLADRPHRLVRRSFLKYAVGAAFVSLAAACAQAPGPSPAPSTSTSAAAPKPQQPTAGAAAVSSSPSPSPAPAPSAAASLDQGLLNAAKSEGQLTIYSSLDPSVLDALGRAVQTEYGLTLDIQRLVSAQLAQRFSAEAQAGNSVADVIITGDALFMDDAASKGWLAEPGALPALEQWPKQYWNGTYATVSIGPHEFAWNTTLVSGSDAPKNWQDIIDPKWNGKVLMTDPRNSAATMGAWFLADQTFGDDFLSNFGKLNAQIIPSVVTASQQLAAGAGSLLVFGTHGAIAPLLAQGAPIAELAPNPTAGAEFVGATIANSPHPNSAKVFLNYCLTAPGQKIINVAASSPVSDWGAQALPPGYQSPDLKQASAASTRLSGLLGLS